MTDWQRWAKEARSAWADAHPQNGGRGAPERWQAMEAELAAAIRVDPLCVGVRADANMQAVLACAASADSDAAAQAVLLEKLAVRFPADRGCMAGHGDSAPDPLLWGSGVRGGVLCRGEVAVLSGAGGVGKSTLALQWALAAALADASETTHGESGGMGVKAGRTLILTYEDSARRVAERSTLALSLPSLAELANAAPDASGAVNERVRVCAMRGWPLWGVSEGRHALTRPDALPAWAAAWHLAATREPDLVIVDPVMSAYVADSHSVAFVRSFVDALFATAERHGCGVLLVAHSTKAARRDKDRDATGAVAGSAAWTDAARGVLTLERSVSAKDGTAGDRATRGHRELRCVKANYSRLFDRDLAEHRTGQGKRFHGFESLADRRLGTNGQAALAGTGESNGRAVLDAI